MGTRADFYVGRGEKAEWLGSIAWDGYPEGVIGREGKRNTGLEAATSADEFRSAVAKFLSYRDDATLPANGWPWPWNDSNTTDYAYAFDGDRMWITDRGWTDLREYDRREALSKVADGADEEKARQAQAELDGIEESAPRRLSFPDMTKVMNVTLGKRSGVLVLRF